MSVPFKQKLVLKVATPWFGIIFPLPFVKRNRSERLLDLAQLPCSSEAALKIVAMMHHDAADHLQDRLKNWPILAIQSTFTQRVISAPPALVRLFQCSNLVTLSMQGIEFASCGNHLPVA
jgi:hypothetical protein